VGCRLSPGLHQNVPKKPGIAPPNGGRSLKDLRFNRPNDDENDIGPLISSAQKGRVEKFVERAAGQGHITITAGGSSPGGKGFFFEPTVVAGAKQDDEIVRKEVFGPVVSVTRFDDVDQ